MRFAVAFAVSVGLAVMTWVGEPGQEPTADEQILRAAGLSTDGAALLEFFHERARHQTDAGKLLELAQKLGDGDAKVRAQTTAEIIACGTSAIPTLRHLLNDLDDPTVAAAAQHCLEWLEGERHTEVPIAAARLLAVRRPPGATAALLAYLPFADDRSVVAAVKTALVTLAKAADRPEPALLKALHDPVPVRRAMAVEVLCSTTQTEVPPDVHKLLNDPKAQVRLRTALALAQRNDEKAIGVLIELLAELAPPERHLIEDTLQQLAGEWAPNPTLAGDDDVSRKIRRGAWAAWWQSTDGPTLLAAFRKQTLSPDQLLHVLTLIDQLGDQNFATRERAGLELVAMGPKVVSLVREAARSPDLERAQRAANCLKLIAQTEDKHKLPAAATRLLAIRNPPGASEALLAYLPFTDDEFMKDEVAGALKQIAVAAGKPDPVLLKTLEDSLPLRRAVAAEVLAAVGGAEHWPTLRKLLKDPESSVRLRVAVALAVARDKEAVPALIELAAELPKGEAWQAEALLNRLAGAKTPQIAAGDDAASRKQFRDAWSAWWNQQNGKVDLALLKSGQSTQGLTLVVERVLAAKKGGKGGGGPGGGGPGGGFGGGGFDGAGFGGDGFGGFQPGGQAGKKGGKGAAPAKAAAKGGAVVPAGTDRVAEVDRNGNPIWQIDNLLFPMDATLLPGNKVLIVEYSGGRVTERDLKGNILWQVNPLQGNPVNAQRLPSGATFVATIQGTLLEVDKAGAVLFSRVLPEQLVAGYKTPAGQIICITQQGICIRLDAAGKEIKRFTVSQQGFAAVGNIDVTPKGNILVVELNAVKEYNPDGKVVWQAKTPATNQSATRLSNGNTLVSSYSSATVTELDGQGRLVWEYQSPPGYHPYRARQR
jgi:HEAT repeat protein